MSYYSFDELICLGFKKVGKNVKVSKKCAIYDPEKIEIGDFSRIDDFCILSGNIVISDYCHITPMCLIAGGELGVELRDFATLAYGVKVFSQSDDYSGETMVNSLVPKKYKKEYKEKVFIGKHCIVGANSTILPGCSIAEGCSIGAMTLVNKKTDPWGIYCGVPAKRLRNRSKNILNIEKKFLKEVLNDSFQ